MATRQAKFVFYKNKLYIRVAERLITLDVRKLGGIKKILKLGDIAYN